ncbi:MAG: FIST N-terminal domain-containing protein [Bacteroidota bacterium]
MKLEQRRWDRIHGWMPEHPKTDMEEAQLILIFGATPLLRERTQLQQIKDTYLHAHTFGCSTAGEICGTQVTDDSIVVTAIKFEHTQLKNVQVNLNQVESSYQAGEFLAKALPLNLPSLMSSGEDKLVHVLVLSDGSKVNGSDLVRGLTSQLPNGTTITGGLAGDGDRFGETLVFGDSEPLKETIAIVGLYGSRLKVGFSSLGGWDSFGPERLITNSKGNVLYELDGHSALELYKKYLGVHAKGLPATGLLFPLGIRNKSGETGVVRTILSVDENEHSMTFAGDVPEGSYARFMKANFDRLIDGAVGAAKTSYQGIGSVAPDLAILISCVGRKLILKQRIEEEVEGVRDVFGEQTILTGFYSYGEISPFVPGTKCELHNQSMTITTLLEE